MMQHIACSFLYSDGEFYYMALVKRIGLLETDKKRVSVIRVSYFSNIWPRDV